MVDDLSEDQEDEIREIASDAAKDVVSATDPRGKTVTFGDLRDRDFTRREAFLALGLVAGGMTLCLAVDAVSDGDKTDVISSRPPSHTPSAVTNGNVLPVAPGLDSSDAIDPETSTTPVQDALDLVAKNDGGHVLLPPKPIEESDTIVMHSQTRLYGYWGGSSIIFPEGVDGLLFDTERSDPSSGEFVAFTEVDGVSLVGPGVEQPNSGSAIRDRGTWLSRIGRLRIQNWSGISWHVEAGANTFENRFDFVQFTNCDAGEPSDDGKGLITWDSYGALNNFGQVSAYPTETHSGLRSRLFATEGLAANIASINVGGSIGSVLTGYFNEIRIGMIHWEPTNLSSTLGPIINISGTTPFALQSLTMNGRAEANFAYSVYSGGNVRLPIPFTADWTSLTENVLRLQNDPDGTIIYEGSSNDVTVQGSGTTGNCQCLGDFSTVG